MQKRTLLLGSWFGMLGRVVSAQDEFRGFLRDLARMIHPEGSLPFWGG